MKQNVDLRARSSSSISICFSSTKHRDCSGSQPVERRGAVSCVRGWEDEQLIALIVSLSRLPDQTDRCHLVILLRKREARVYRELISTNLLPYLPALPTAHAMLTRELSGPTAAVIVRSLKLAEAVKRNCQLHATHLWHLDIIISALYL